MSDTKKKLLAAFEKLGMMSAHKQSPATKTWSPEEFASMLAPLLDTVWLRCPNCRKATAEVTDGGPANAPYSVLCETCGMEGPLKHTSDEALEVWQKIRIQDSPGSVYFDVGIQAIDDINWIFEDCQRRGMKAEPIGTSGKENSMRGQIERFIRTLATTTPAVPSANFDAAKKSLVVRDPKEGGVYMQIIARHCVTCQSPPDIEGLGGNLFRCVCGKCGQESLPVTGEIAAVEKWNARNTPTKSS